MRYIGILLIALLTQQSLYAQSPRLEVESVAPSVYVHTSYNMYNGQLFPSNGLIVDTKKGLC